MIFPPIVSAYEKPKVFSHDKDERQTNKASACEKPTVFSYDKDERQTNKVGACEKV